DGFLIAIEGADASGRSTQVEMLKSWLERLGYAVVDFGLKRSQLIGEEIAAAQEGNTLGPITRSLFYATDFHDQLENVVVPALRAGMIVLADRYVYTLMARDLVRGADLEWVRNLYATALVPDAVFYLKVSPQNLLERTFAKGEVLNHWESGMDIGLSRDMFESFHRYQRLIAKAFKGMEAEYGFITVNGNRGIDAINRDFMQHLITLLQIPEWRLRGE
ncbi:MAG TPA: dTMP kinase, partial [bacterium]|nr:dTMP kinase [bacterium]